MGEDGPARPLLRGLRQGEAALFHVHHGRAGDVVGRAAVERQDYQVQRFQAHLNTGSDLFHWVRDTDILEDKQPGVTVRFVDDWGDGASMQDTLVTEDAAADDDEPDWLGLEQQPKVNYDEKSKDETRVLMENENTLLLGGRWCSAYKPRQIGSRISKETHVFLF